MMKCVLVVAKLSVATLLLTPVMWLILVASGIEFPLVSKKTIDVGIITGVTVGFGWAGGILLHYFWDDEVSRSGPFVLGFALTSSIIFAGLFSIFFFVEPQKVQAAWTFPVAIYDWFLLSAGVGWLTKPSLPKRSNLPS